MSTYSVYKWDVCLKHTHTHTLYTLPHCPLSEETKKKQAEKASLGKETHITWDFTRQIRPGQFDRHQENHWVTYEKWVDKV